MSIRIRYKGVESEEFPLIHPDGSQAERTLLTAGKYCEDDITVISDIFPTDEILGSDDTYFHIDDALNLGIASSGNIRFSANIEPATSSVPGYYSVYIAIKTSLLPAEYTATWIDTDDSTDTAHTPEISVNGSYTTFILRVTEPSRVFDWVELSITVNKVSTKLSVWFPGFIKHIIKTYQTDLSKQSELYGVVAKMWALSLIHTYQTS